MTTGYISIGSNIDKETNIPASLDALKILFGAIESSSLYETEAVGFSGENFYNLIVRFESELPAEDIASRLRQIELAHGRTRNCQKFSARTLDLDLVLYGHQIIASDTLKIPRDEIEKYAFVLEPLAEIAGDQLHPVSGISFQQLWDEFDKTKAHQTRIDGLI